MNQLNSYPTVFQLGHSAVKDIFQSEVQIEEKIDGSQWSMAVIDGELVCRSRGKQLIVDAPEKMFNKAVLTAKELAPRLTPGWVYRGEFLSTPKHNTLAYGDVPPGHIIIFDIMTGPETYLDYESKAVEAARLGLMTVPLLFRGIVESYEMFQSILERESILGGCKIEGVVIKNYQVFTPEKKVAIAKYVSEAFKETHNKEWKKGNPNSKDLETLLIEQYRTEARWQKAIQHLRESGLLTDSPQDIPLLLREIGTDVEKECAEEIKEALYKYYWPKIQRGVIRGLPEFYKDQLAKSAFE